ncbi:MAG: hypothetical protein RIS94_706 [Pseudomonadota bacterium]
MNGQPFGRGTVMGMVLVGLLAFVALLWWLGNGASPANNGGSHAGGRGLNGYAGLAAMLEADGFEVTRARGKDALRQPGLLILTPPPAAGGAEIAKIVDARRAIGPTLVVTPKWQAAPISDNPAAKRGWTEIVGTATPEWRGFADDVTVALGGAKDAPAGGWRTVGRAGPLPDDRRVLSGQGDGLAPLVRTADGRILAAWLRDDGYYPALDAFAGVRASGEDGDLYPVVLVFEPDLLDNWGLADPHTGTMARDLVLAAAGTRSQPVTFDLTLVGLGASRNLATLAFEQPFLAATICLLLAVLAAMWRAFLRFGPPRAPGRAIALGKTALVANTAGLIRRAGRLLLIAGPYADAARERLVLTLGLPRGRAPADSEAAIDAVLARRGLNDRFSGAADRLRHARRAQDIARRAGELQRIEKELAK